MRKSLAVLLMAVLCLSTLALAKDKYQRPGPVHLDRDGEKWAEKTLKKLSLEEKIGQMLLIWARAEFVNVNSPEYERLKEAMTKYHLGGFGLTVPVQYGLLVKSEPYEAAALLNELQHDSKVPLIIGADFERGVSMRLNGTTVFPHAMAFGAAGKPEYAEAFGRITAEEARAIGVTWNWFPDADVNSNPANPVINTRAFGGDAKQVSDLVVAYIKGARAAGMLTTAKHFPGHGDTGTDSHLSVARVDGNLARLESVELPPFKAAIAAGVDSIMVAHVTVPALDPDPNRVGTNSPKVITELLKNKMGFKGLIVTDALDMNGLMRLYANQPGVNPSAAAAVATVKAGNDMVLIPGDLDAAYNGLLNAVRSGEISQKQIDQSVLKILKAKASVGLHKAKLVDLEALNRTVLSPQNKAVAQQISDSAVTLVRAAPNALPFERSAPPQGTSTAASPYVRTVQTRNRVVAVVLTDDVRAETGRTFARELRQRVRDANVLFVDDNNAAFATDPVLVTVENAERVIVAVAVVPQPGKVNADGRVSEGASVTGAQAALLHAVLQKAAARTTVVALGNPYVATDFPEVQTYLCTFSNAAVSESSAVRALFGEIAVNGRLPVNIPGIAQRGEGIERPQAANARKQNSGGQKNASGK